MDRLKKNMFVELLPLSFIIIAFILDTPTEISEGLIKITTHPSILLNDYIAIGGIGATLINSALLLIFNIFSLRLYGKKQYSGPIYAGLLTIAGFAFFGKNIVNVIPAYIGIYVYSAYEKIDYRRVILFTLFATGLAPLVSGTMFGLGIDYIYSIPLGIILGVGMGFIIPAVSAASLRFHAGYDLYNIGFTAGLVGMVYYGFIKAIGLNLNIEVVLSDEYHYMLLFLVLAYSAILLLVGFIGNGNSFKGYNKILKQSGRAITDFKVSNGVDLTMINIGIMGLVSIIFILLLGVRINGPIWGGILTVIGFAAFGKHPRNSIPVMIGVIILAYFSVYDIQSTVVVIAIFFVTALAPIAGQYGTLAGIITGILHLGVVMMTAPLHGGMNLYNNGFAAGFVAAVMISILDIFKEPRED